MFREEATSALAGFHAGPLSWSNMSLWREENRRTRRKTLGPRTRTNNKLNPHMAPGPGMEPDSPHWWEASALTTAPSLHPYAAYFNHNRADR